MTLYFALILMVASHFVQAAHSNDDSPISRQEILEFQEKIQAWQKELEHTITVHQKGKPTTQNTRTRAVYKKAILIANDALKSMNPKQPAANEQKNTGPLKAHNAPKNQPLGKKEKKLKTDPQELDALLQNAEQEQTDHILKEAAKKSNINSLKKLPSHLSNDWLTGVLKIMDKEPHPQQLWVSDNFKQAIQVLKSKGGLIIFCNVTHKEFLCEPSSAITVTYNLKTKSYEVPELSLSAKQYFYINPNICQQAASQKITRKFGVYQLTENDQFILHEFGPTK